jgi:uncharacterized RDD family membrane protein YckC
MKSLEDITIQRTNTHIQTGSDGMNREITRTYKQKLNVKTIDAGLRFVHIIVDYFILVIITYLIGAIPAINNTLLSLLNLITILSYPVFYAVMEYKFQQTPGKMLTNYVVIDKFANKPDFKTCLLRTLIRFVPFEAFSCLSSPSRGWHDRWTSTYVVHKNEVAKLKLLVNKEE